MLYKIIPKEEHKEIKCKEVEAKSQKGALIKFNKIWKIKGKIMPKSTKFTYESRVLHD